MKKKTTKKKITKLTKEEKAVQAQVSKLLKKEVKKIREEEEKKLKKMFNQHKKNMAVKAGVYNEQVQEKRKELNEWTHKFFKALVANDYATLKDMGTGTGGAGGYLLRNDFIGEVQHLMTEYGVARREMTFVNMSTKSLDLNNLATDIDAYWTDEGAAKTSDDITIGRVTLTLNKLAVITPMTDELLEDSEIDLVGLLTERIAEKMSQKEDEAFFNGDGTSSSGGFTGILQNGSVNVVTMAGTTFASMDADDLLDMQDSSPQAAVRNGKYYMHRSIESIVRKLKDTTGEYIYQKPTDKEPAQVWGKPIVKVEAMPTSAETAPNTAFVIFGDLKKCAWVGARGGMRVKLADQATVRNTADEADINLFEQDQTALRVVERVGFVVVIPTAATVLKTAAVTT